jgi:HEAT repeat protein
MMYSHGMQSSRTAADSPVTAGAIEQNSAPSGIGSTAWASAAIAVNPPSHQAAPGPKAVAAKAVNASRDDNLEKRVEPVEALARRGDPEAVPAVLDALHDDDWRVRSRVIDAAVNAYVPIPESALIEHAQSDPSAEVRFGALAGIAARIDPAIPQVDAVDPGTARAISRQALSDASEPVRWQAQQILDTLDAKTSTPSNEPLQAEML